ncbi:MAG: hypothetical protein ACOYI9_12870 [Candidatus Hydrogenedentales bacterium]|jgi:hypothetical protein
MIAKNKPLICVFRNIHNTIFVVLCTLIASLNVEGEIHDYTHIVKDLLELGCGEYSIPWNVPHLSSEQLILLKQLYKDTESVQNNIINPNNLDEYIINSSYFDIVCYRNVLIIKVLYEYAIKDYAAVSQSLKCLLAYSNAYYLLESPIGMHRHFLFQNYMYDLLYKFDLIKVIDVNVRNDIIEYLVGQIDSYNLISFAVNECKDYNHTTTFLDEQLRSDKIMPLLYRLDRFRKAEIDHINSFTSYIIDQLNKIESYNDYEPYSLRGGGLFPGRIYAHKVIRGIENMLKSDYTRRNRSLILLWAIAIHTHKNLTGAFPSSLNAINFDDLNFDDLNLVSHIGIISKKSLTSGVSIGYDCTDTSFIINGGIEYSAISGAGSEQNCLTIYVGEM